MMTFLLRLFTWWNSQTFGTQLWTALYGEFVGEDEFGNRYYRTRGGKIDPTLRIERRWVVYNGIAEASKVPPGWHGWLHHVVGLPPTQDKTTPRPWEKPHRPNLTGTRYGKWSFAGTCPPPAQMLLPLNSPLHWQATCKSISHGLRARTVSMQRYYGGGVAR